MNNRSAPRQLLAFLSVPATHGCEFSLRKVLNNMFGVAAAVFTGANETDAQRLHGKERYPISIEAAKGAEHSR